MYDTISCLPIMSDRATTEGSKYFKLGQQPHEFFNSKYLLCYPYILAIFVETFLGAAAGSPYIVLKLTFSYGFMLRICNTYSTVGRSIADI